MQLPTIDLVVFFGYILAMMGFGVWIANREKTESAQDYFLASKALPWWAVGGSLIASNISTEQIMGMNGSGFEIGLAIASYELMAAITLILVAKYFLPVFLKKGIYTMPQFLEMRYNRTVRTIMSIFWVALFVLVNITSVLYLGGLAIKNLMGIPLFVGILGLVIYSASFSIFGGLKAVVWTDVVQVVILIFGGFLASYFVVSAVGDGNFLGGLEVLYEKTPERFNMIFGPADTYTERLTGNTLSSYNLLPGIGVLLGGMWIANIYYWGNNQYIIQRALASKNLGEAQRGVAFAAFLKILMPIIVIVPGIAAFVLNADINKADEAFPWVLNNYVGIGFKGLTFAALVAAIGSSISSMVNSASTIFTLDIYKELINPAASEKTQVRIGKLSAAGALVVGALLGPLLGNLGQVIQFIQEYTGFISPGVVAIFLFGMFWKRTTAKAAVIVVILAIPLSTAFKLLLPQIPFIDRMAITFLICSFVLVILSIIEGKQLKAVTDSEHTDVGYRLGLIAVLVAIAGVTGVKLIIEPFAAGSVGWGAFTLALTLILCIRLLNGKGLPDVKAIDLEKGLFKTDRVFNSLTLVICLILAAIYAALW